MTFRALTIAALAGSILAMSLPTAEAGKRYHRHHYHHNNGAAAAIIGLGFGVMIGSLLAQPRHRYGYDDYGYEEPVRYPYRPQPWTEEWYVYCDQKYKTFDPRTGKFRGYDGRLHLCR